VIPMQGVAHRFGDNVTTDDVIAGKYKHSSIDPAELAQHLMENVRPGFAQTVRVGDFIVAGSNFGCGSSREQAPQIIRHIGVRAVIAESFARIFFRNSINIGLPMITCETAGISDGDLLALDDVTGILSVASRGLVLSQRALPPDIQAIIAAGGLLGYVAEQGTL
jgi:3-isopropylmalate/(R)-2-methylmalate dehydratase small subunit